MFGRTKRQSPTCQQALFLLIFGWRRSVRRCRGYHFRVAQPCRHGSKRGHAYGKQEAVIDVSLPERASGGCPGAQREPPLLLWRNVLVTLAVISSRPFH